MIDSIFTIGATNVTEYLDYTLGTTDPAVISPFVAAYSVGNPGLANDYDAISQIFTDIYFQCVSG